MDCQSTSHIVTIVSIVYISRLHSEKCRAYASVTAAFDGTACIESFFLVDLNERRFIVSGKSVEFATVY